MAQTRVRIGTRLLMGCVCMGIVYPTHLFYYRKNGILVHFLLFCQSLSMNVPRSTIKEYKYLLLFNLNTFSRANMLYTGSWHIVKHGVGARKGHRRQHLVKHRRQIYLCIQRWKGFSCWKLIFILQIAQITVQKFILNPFGAIFARKIKFWRQNQWIVTLEWFWLWKGFQKLYHLEGVGE